MTRYQIHYIGSIVRMLMVTGLILCVSSVATTLAQTKPISSDDLATLVKVGIGDDVILSRLKENGIGFSADEKTLQTLKAAGASEKVLSALKGMTPSSKPADAKALSFDELLKLVNLKIGDEVILKRIKDSGSRLDLTPEQVKQLKDGGASDLLVANLSAPPDLNAMIILDCSQRMAGKLGDGSVRMNAARNALGAALSAMPDGLPVGIICCGQSPAGDRSVANLTRPLKPLTAADRDDVILLLATASPGGKAALAEALNTAGKELEKSAVKGAKGGGILLITAGLDDAGGDAAAAVKQLASMPNFTASIHVAALGVSEGDAKQLAQWSESTKGQFANITNSEELVKLMTPKTTATPLSTTSGRRAIKVQTPKVSMPDMSSIVLAKPDAGYGTLNSYRFADAPKYDQEIRVPSADPFDIWWVGKEGLPVCIVRNVEIKERKIVDIQLETYLGMLVVKGEGLPAAKAIVVTPSDKESGAGTASSYQIQSSDAFGKVMVLPSGEYDIWVFPKDGASASGLEKKFKIEAGKLHEID